MNLPFMVTLSLLSQTVSLSDQQVDLELRALADLLEEDGDLDQAIDVYDQLLIDRPNDIDLLESLVSLCMRSTPCAPRREVLVRRALRIVPDRVGLMEDLHEVLIAQGNEREAFVEVEAFLARHPGSEDRWRPVIDAFLEKAGRSDFALRRLRAYVERRPRDLRLRLLWVDALAERRDARRLDRALMELGQVFPSSAAVWVRIGDRALEREELAAARAAFLRARETPAKSRQTRSWIKELGRQVQDAMREREEEYLDFRREVDWADLADELGARDDG